MTRPDGYNRQAWQYEEDVLSGKIVAGRLLKLAIERQRRDLRTGAERGLYFDHEEGQRIVDFAGLCNLGPDAPFFLFPFQVWELYVFYGWRQTENGKRRFRDRYKSCARGSGKTPLEALQILYHLCIDGPYGAEAYVSATKEDQAKIAFTDAKNILENSPDLSEVFPSPTATTIFCPERNSKFQFLTSNPKTADGTRPTYATIDEYHEFDSDAMLNKLRTGLIKKPNSILSIVTTRGSHKDWPCFEAERRVYVPILEGSIINDDIFVVIYSQDSEEEFDDPETWQKSNPMLCEGGIIDIVELIKERDRQIINGEEGIVYFKTLNLNWWCDAPQTFIPDQIWVRSGSEKPEGYSGKRWREEFEAGMRGKTCYAGLDMGQTSDFCSLCLLFPPEDWQRHDSAEMLEKRDLIAYVRTPLRVPGQFRAIWRYWIPAYKFEARIQAGLHSLRDWQQAGYIRMLDGNVIDPTEIEADIRAMNVNYPIASLFFDRFNATSTALALEKAGIPCTELGQTMPLLTGPTAAFRDIVLQERFDHGHNPIIRWNMRNAVPITDTNGNVKLTKDPRRAPDKIDGAAACVNAFAAWMSAEAHAPAVEQWLF
jgi:phage terminase large subunit-like protein